MTRTSRAALVAILMSLAVTPARAGELHGRIRETWTRISTNADPDYTDTVVQDYQLNFRNMIARNLSWQMRLRALLQGSDRDDTTAATDTALLEPFFQIVYEGPAWQASGGARMTRVSPKGGGSTAIDRERRDFFGRVEWSDEIADAQSMDVSWSFYRLEREEDGVNLSEDDRSILSVGYLASPGGITVGVENRNSEDLVSGFERDAVEFTASGDLRHTFSAAKLTIAGRALASEQFRDEYTPRAIDVEVQRDARAGLFGVDNTAGMDPLMDTPGLIDGDRNSTAVDIDGRDRNYGADFGFPKDIERVLLYLERRLQAGNEQDFAFDVYTSDDGDLWTIRASFSTQEFHSNCSDLDPGRSQTPPPGWCFEPLQNRFEIRISPSQARFVKVVNTSFSSAEVPLGVTEIQIFGEERRTGRTEFDASRQSGNLTFGWRPSTPMTVNLHFVGSRLTNGGPSMQQTEEDFTSTLASSYRSARNVTTTGRLQAANRNSTTGRPERDRVTSLSVAGSPVPDVDLSASGTRRRNSTPGGVISANDSINLRGAVRLAAHTQTSLDLSFARLDNREIGRIQNRRVGRCALVTTLRPGLLLTNDWTVSRLEFESDEDLPSRTDFDLRSRISYRPSQVLGGSFEYLYQDVAGRQGTSRLLDVDWLPFPGGALQLQFTLVRDRLGDRGAVLDEERVGMRWTLNPRTLFESNYGTVRRGDATGTSSSRSLSAFLEFRF